MLARPSAATELLMSFSGASSEPIFRRVLLLCLGAIVAPRRRTVSAMQGAMRPLVNGQFTSFHRIFSHASWSLWTLGVILAQAMWPFAPPEPIPSPETAPVRWPA